MAEAHVRIDEGIKRGPRKPRKPPIPPDHTALVPPRKKNGSLKHANLDEILTRYLSDETTQQIADSLNVHRSALHQWLLRNAEEPWKQAQVARAITALEQAKDDLSLAGDPLSLARAREQLRGAQWELERVFSRVYGQKQEVKIDIDLRVQIDHALTSEANELLNRVRGVVAGTSSKAIAAPSSPEKVINPTSTQDN